MSDAETIRDTDGGTEDPVQHTVVDVTDDVLAVAQEYFAAVAVRDVGGMAQHWDERSTDYFHALDLTVAGEDELRAFFDELFGAMPDAEVRVEALHGTSDGVAIGQWHLLGTFDGGPFQGIEPTGRPIELTGVDVMRFEGQMVRRTDVYYDGMSFARQVGLLPAADSTADKGMLAAFNALTNAKRGARSAAARAREARAVRRAERAG